MQYSAVDCSEYTGCDVTVSGVFRTSGLRVEVESETDKFFFLVFVAVAVPSATHYFPFIQQANREKREERR